MNLPRAEQSVLAGGAATSSSPRVRFENGLVYKQGEPAALEMEALRMGLAAAVGENSGCFLVPKLYRLDSPGGPLVSEFIPGLWTLRQVAWEARQAQEPVFQAAGRALATVHRKLQLPPAAVRPMPAKLRLAGEPEVALHADFCVGNVCWHPGQGRIVLLDWATAPPLDGIVTYGSRYFDLVWFAWSLFFWAPAWRLLQGRPERLMRALARGYGQVEGQFRWQGYLRYRRLMGELMGEYWRRKQAMVPSGPRATCAQLLGWWRWRRFPRTGSFR